MLPKTKRDDCSPRAAPCENREFPVIPSPESNSIPVAPPPTRQLELPERILIVEDDPGIRRLLRATFRSVPVVIEADNGAEGLERIHQDHPDFVITDLHMPVMDGLEMIAQARRSSGGATVPIVVLTGDGEENVLVDAFYCGADDFMKKPFSMSELRTRTAAIHVRQRLARDVNPLTKLPGNTALKREIRQRLHCGGDFAVAYFDLDHFKEFNDTQGFDRGDHVINLLGDLLCHYARTRPPSTIFIGHVGGDDFVMVMPEEEVIEMANFVHRGFETATEGLYTAQELAKGSVRTFNRRGNEEDVPLLSVSIGVVTTSREGMRDLRKISHVAAEVKKVAKSIAGNSLFIDRRKDDPVPKSSPRSS